MAFEAEVRYVAEAIWGLESGACQPKHYPDDPVVTEIDGIARLRDVTHLLMVTTSTKLEKVRSDIKKLNAAENREKNRAGAISKWLITQVQIDARHIGLAKENNVSVLTFGQFKQRFFDGRDYLLKRENTAFGSARNPSDNKIEIPDNAYVPLPMVIVEQVKVKSHQSYIMEEKNTPIDVKGVVNLIREGFVIVLVAAFGSGKSLTTREVFKKISFEYRNKNDSIVPICLNLREHWGQKYFDEMLERHARSIGFKPKEDLVVAWRAGLTCILLDGFDEVASQTIVRRDNINFMRDARRTALEGVKDFFTKKTGNIGALICGRDHYFDNFNEMKHSLGVSENEIKLVRLGEFTEDGANEFLRRQNISEILPEWLPRKPLLLSYLIQEKLLEEILKIDSSIGYGYAWDTFITKITQRESELERAVMDAVTLRAVMERLAFFVRSLVSGTGPITGNDLANAYNIETGQSADEGVLAQLQRLPGLTQRDQDAGLRSFIDEDMLSVLQGGAFARIIFGDFKNDPMIPLSPLSDNSIKVATYILTRNEANCDMPVAYASQLISSGDSDSSRQLAADCISVALNMAKIEEKSVDCRYISIKSAVIGDLDIEDITIKNIEYSDCIINSVVIGIESLKANIRFINCAITRISGVSSKSGLPSDMFSDSCDIQEFDDIGTNNAVLQLDIAPQIKALLTILKKTYYQAGAGRKIAALGRGITKQDVLKFIPDVLEILRKNGLVSVYGEVVQPVRKQSSRVEAILNAPSLCDDEIISHVKELA